MTVIELHFPAGGRLHATPWGRHVNEGATEWPISPWRILRALVATWYLKARNDISHPTMVTLIDALASEAPAFELPPAIQSHTRHYMPGHKTDKPKVFDTFIQSERPIRIAWNTDLDETGRLALHLLCDRLGYLGRAESIVEAKLLEITHPFTANSVPIDHSSTIPDGHELVRVLCPTHPSNHATWASEQQPKDEPKTKGKGGKSSKSKAAINPIPNSIFEALHAETGTLQSQGWLIPPGSTWVNYSRRVDSFEPGVKRPRQARSQTVTVARFAISSAALPRITQAISVADRVHKTLVKRADGMDCASVFTGKASDGQPLSGNRHTHIFCELGEKRDHIAYITLYAPGGYDNAAQHVIEDLQQKAVWGHGGHDLELALLGFGQVGDFDSAIFGTSRQWTSLTPFVSTRHAKHYADGRPKLDVDGWPIGAPAQDLRRLVQQKLGMTPKSISQPSHQITVRPQRTLRTLQYQTERDRGQGRHGHQPAVGLTLEFDQEIQGPLAFGYGSHFGLGLFMPVDHKDRLTT